MLPPEHAIDATCKICFRGDKSEILTRPLAPVDDEELPVETSSSSSSGSSSSSEAASEDEGAQPPLISPAKRPRRGA